ncbi:MAG: imidazoleglycerol-phosphate dehydratase [Candidatus Thorarchaeota archaeon]
MRTAVVNRTTKETDVSLALDLDGQGVAEIDFSPVFMQHMVTSMVVHSGLDVTIKAQGDLQHHIIEDVALCLGKAIRESVGDYRTISRFGHAIVPMDCSLALAAVDICNRPHAVIDLSSTTPQIEDTQTEDIEHFLHSLATSLSAAVHLKVLYGDNEHHKIEAAFKALGMALRSATRMRGNYSPPASSKGVL